MSREGEREFVWRRFGVRASDPSAPGGGLSGWDANGLHAEADFTDTPFTGSFQPVTQKDLERLREGYRTTDLVKVYTEAPIETVDQYEGRMPDRLVDGDTVYQVAQTQHWGPEHHIPHTKFWAVRFDEASEGGGDIAPGTDAWRIVQAIRAVFKSGLALSNAQIIMADDDGPRPPLPYLDVRPESVDIGRLTASDSVQWTCPDPDTVAQTVHGLRTALVSVRGYGDQAPRWLSAGSAVWQVDDILAALVSDGIHVVDVSPTRNISIVLDTQTERRWEQTWEVMYVATSDPVEAPALESVCLDLELSSTTTAPSFNMDVSDQLPDPC